MRRLRHLAAALGYAALQRFSRLPVLRRLAQYHRAEALPDRAVSIRRFGPSVDEIGVSIVIPSFDYAEHLPTAVRSALTALAAIGPDGAEILIVDDRSTDGSHAVACGLLQASPIPAAVIRPLWNVGLSRARNIGRRHARGRFVFFLDADNTVDAAGLAALYRQAQADGADAAYGPIRRVTLDGEDLGLLSELPFDPDRLVDSGNYIDAMALFRRSALNALGGYDVGLLRIIGGWEDYALWLRFARDKRPVSFCPDTIVGTYVVKHDSMVKRISLKEQKDAFERLDAGKAWLDNLRRKPLVFDLGFHLGEDATYYLSAGYDVVAVEADPDLFRLGTENFAEHVASGRLTLVHAAAVGHESRLSSASIMFHPHPTRSLWGTVDAGFVERNTILHESPHADPVEVPTICLEDLVRDFGSPFFIKVDIEGRDAEVVADVHRLPVPPVYVSWETGKRNLFAVLRSHIELYLLGYSRFRIAQQSGNHTLPMPSEDGTVRSFPVHSSGPLPDRHPARWSGLASVMIAYVALFLVYRLIGPGSPFVRAERSPHPLIHAAPRWIRRFADRRRIPFPGWVDSHAGLASD